MNLNHTWKVQGFEVGERRALELVGKAQIALTAVSLCCDYR